MHHGLSNALVVYYFRQGPTISEIKVVEMMEVRAAVLSIDREKLNL